MDVIVIGGGPAGCAAAYTLTKQGHNVRLFEAADIVGGRTRQLTRDGFNLGTGALFLMGGIYPRTSALLREMKLFDKLVPWGGRSQLMDSDDKRYPVSFVSLPSYLMVPKLKLIDRLKLAATYIKLLFTPGAENPFDGGALAKYDKGENLEDWSRRNLGNRAHEYILRPLMDFLYAVPASWLSTPFPLAIIKQAHKMKLSVPPGGVGQVSQGFVEKSPGPDLHLSTRVDAVEQGPAKHMMPTASSSRPRASLPPGCSAISSPRTARRSSTKPAIRNMRTSRSAMSAIPGRISRTISCFRLVMARRATSARSSCTAAATRARCRRAGRRWGAISTPPRSRT